MAGILIIQITPLRSGLSPYRDFFELKFHGMPSIVKRLLKSQSDYSQWTDKRDFISTCAHSFHVAPTRKVCPILIISNRKHGIVAKVIRIVDKISNICGKYTVGTNI